MLPIKLYISEENAKGRYISPVDCPIARALKDIGIEDCTIGGWGKVNFEGDHVGRYTHADGKKVTSDSATYWKMGINTELTFIPA